MSGAEGAATRARFQTLHIKLVSLLQNERCITSAAARQEQHQEVIDRLCFLVRVMRAKGDFQLIDDLLAQAEDASCR